jgi:hypothetical protein
MWKIPTPAAKFLFQLAMASSFLQHPPHQHSPRDLLKSKRDSGKAKKKTQKINTWCYMAEDEDWELPRHVQTCQFAKPRWLKAQGNLQRELLAILIVVAAWDRNLGWVCLNSSAILASFLNPWGVGIRNWNSSIAQVLA